MKTLMKVVWYLEAALCGCVGWLMLVIGLQLVMLCLDACARVEFYILAGLVLVFILVYAWKAQRQQRAEMLGLLEMYFGGARAERYDAWHTILATASVVAVFGVVILATILERSFGKVALDVGFGLPMLLGIAGILVKVAEAAFVKWMPKRVSNMILLYH